MVHQIKSSSQKKRITLAAIIVKTTNTAKNCIIFQGHKFQHNKRKY